MLSEQQKKILAFPYSKYTSLICDGAIRSGKTSIMMYAFVKWAMDNFNNCLFGICGKTVDSAIKNIVVPFMGMTINKELYRLDWSRTAKTLTVRNGKSKNTFEVFGGKDESSFMLIQGRTLAGILLDEVVLQPQSFVNQALARCSVEGAKHWFSCNPGSPSHWFFKEWIQKPNEKNALYLHFDITDNPSLSEDTLKKYNSIYEGVFYERYIKGRWIAAEGIIYRQFADNKEMFIIDKVPETLRIVAIGLDYGAGKSKTSMKAVGFNANFTHVYILKEKDISEVYSPEDLYKAFHEFYKAVVSEYGKCQYVSADWGGLGTTLNKGLYVYCLKNKIPIAVENCDKGTIMERIELTLKLFSEHRLYILRECQNMITAFSDALWDSKKTDTRLDNGTTDIDSLDAFEYALFKFEEYLLKAVIWQNDD